MHRARARSTFALPSVYIVVLGVVHYAHASCTFDVRAVVRIVILTRDVSKLSIALFSAARQATEAGGA